MLLRYLYFKSILYLAIIFLSLISYTVLAKDDGNFENALSKFKSSVANHVDSLANELNINVPEDAKKGNKELTSKRALLALVSLLREEHICAAVCITTSPEKKLWISYNNASEGFAPFMAHLKLT